MSYKIFIEGQKYSNSGTSNAVNSDKEISSKIKAIPEEDANSEIEKGELVLDPETGAIHKALGKSHSKGGTPVNLKDNSFIFSNFKDLAINRKEKDLFEFKYGGTKPKNNTPAKVLDKEIDIQHHNKMIDVLQDSKKYDDILNNSAKLMVLKNLEKAGQVAFLQESKKNNPTPDFAKNTAPIYSSDTDDEIKQSMQYLQSGGTKLTPEQLALKNKLLDNAGWNPFKKEGLRTFYKKYMENNGPKMSNAQWTAFINSPAGKASRASRQAGQYQYGYTEGNVNKTAPEQTIPITPNPVTPPSIQQRNTPNIPPMTGNHAGNPNGIVDPKNYNTKLTPWQQFNLGIPFYRAATVKTQYPLRQHQESYIPQFENQNVQPMLNQNNQSYFNAANTTRAINPTQASSYLQQLYGNRIDANNQAIGQVQNNNIQTQNNQKNMAASYLNNDAAQNRGFDLKYYDQTQTAIKNRDELKQAYTQQGINNINDTMTKKLSFDSWLNTQQQYRGKPTYIDKDGIQHYEGQALYTPKPGFFGNSIQYNPANIDWSTYTSVSGNKIDSPEELGKAYQEMLKFMPGLTPDAFIKSRTLLNYNTNASNVQQSFKKGGKYIPKLKPNKINYYN